MALTDEEKAQLAALQKKESEPDDSDFDIEIWDETGAGAKVPYRKGRTWLQRFGIDLDPEPEGEGEGEGEGQAASGKPRGSSAKGQANVTHAAKYFGNRGKAS